MNLDLSPEQESFRSRVRDWLRENAPKEPQPLTGPALAAFDKAWQRKMHDAGYAGIAWPKEYGGCGFDTVQQLLWLEEYARAGGPDVGVNFVGLNHAGPTLIARASETQKAYHLPRILTGEAVWCQGFSEPGAGSDLASLRTRGRIEADHIVVSGSKIWTSYAEHAHFQELLIRTDPDSERHKGLTWIICDMTLPGITIRPIGMMSGGHNFCEVFYDDVRIPVENVVGKINEGWSVAMSTLSFERGTGFIAEQILLEADIDRLRQDILEGKLGARPETLTRIGTLRAQILAIKAMTYASVARNERQGGPGPEGSLIKLQTGAAKQALNRLRADLMGADALAFDGESRTTIQKYLYSHAATIGGGTTEIQREIVADRLLGLPRSR